MKKINIILLASLAVIGLSGCGESPHPKKYAQLYTSSDSPTAVYAYGYPYWYVLNTAEMKATASWTQTTRPSSPTVLLGNVTGKQPALVSVDQKGKPDSEEETEQMENMEATIDEAPTAESDPMTTTTSGPVPESIPEPPQVEVPEPSTTPSAPAETGTDSSSSSSDGGGGGDD